MNHAKVALTALQRDIAVEIANNSEAVNETLKVRYQVYCLERNFEPGQDGLESDEYDSISRHVLLRHLPTGQAIGTVRLVVPRLKGPRAELPMEQVAHLPRLRHLPREQIAEVSRFAMSEAQRAASGCLGHLLRLALIRGIVQLRV
jgi:N-acyl amino acid synthase of PEP-CTERM/exosortase system